MVAVSPQWRHALQYDLSEFSFGTDTVRFRVWMSRILGLIGSIACVVMLLGWGAGPRAATSADDCLVQPNSSAPEGSHWYYHIDRATQRKCWYLRALDQQAEHPAAHTSSPVTSAAPIPLEKPATATLQARSTTPIPPEKPRAAIPLEKSATVPGGATMSVTPTLGPPLPHIQMLTVVSNGATDTLGQQDAKKQKTNSPITTAAPAPEESASQTSDQVTEPARTATIAWPDPPTSAMAAHDPLATPVAAPIEEQTESIQPTSDAKSADAAEATARPDASANSPGAVNASVMSEPVEMSVVAALGLVVAGFLFRIAVKIAGTRRRRIVVDRPESHWVDDPNEHELRDEQGYAELVHQREELIDEFIDRPDSDRMVDRNEHELRDGEQRAESVHQEAKLIDDFRGSVVLTASDDTRHRLFRNDHWLQETPQRRDREPNVADEIAKREDRLEQLKRDLDRLLRSPKLT